MELTLYHWRIIIAFIGVVVWAFGRKRKTRFEKDYVRVWNEEELAEWVERGYSVRMSNPGVSSHRAASLISPDSITREVESHTAWPSHAAEVPSTRNFLLGVALLVCIIALLFAVS